MRRSQVQSRIPCYHLLAPFHSRLPASSHFRPPLLTYGDPVHTRRPACEWRVIIRRFVQ